MNPLENPRVLEAEYVGGAPTSAALPEAFAPEIAFGGRSNVGKSSLMNSMLARKSLVRVGKTPGVTRQIQLFSARLDDATAWIFADLPGYGFAVRSKSERGEWKKMVEDFLTKRPSLFALAILVDARRGPEEEEQELVQFVNARAPHLRLVGVVTKVDKLSLSERKPILAKVQKAFGIPVVGYSAVTHDGRAELWKRVRAAHSKRR